MFNAQVRVKTLRIKQHTVQDIVFALPAKEHLYTRKPAWPFEGINFLETDERHNMFMILYFWHVPTMHDI